MADSQLTSTAKLYELDAARCAKRDEVLQSRIEEGLCSTSEVRVRSLTGLKNPLNALVYRFLSYICEHLGKTDEMGKVSRAIRVACKAVRDTSVSVYCAESALEVKGIGPHIANVLDRSLFHLYPQQAPRGQGESLAAETSREARATAEGPKRGGSGRGAAGKKAYRPKNGTANYAFLVCMHKLMIQGEKFVLKQDLIRIAESSSLSSKSIHGTKSSSSGNRHANWYNGWSSFLQMKQKDPPLVRTWSNPLKCELTPDGVKVAEELHRNAHDRLMCTCDFMRGQENKENVVQKTWGNWQAPSAAPAATCVGCDEGSEGGEGGSRKRPRACEVSEACEDGLPGPAPCAGYESRIQPFRSGLPRGDLRLPPLEAGEKFSDVYDVVLFLDNREQFARGSGGGSAAASSGSGGSRSGRGRAEHLEMYTKSLTDSGLKVVTGKLAVGDITWVARRRVSAGGGPSSSQDYYVLDYIAERKSVDDLIDSIKSNRYGMQKHLLKKSGVPNVMYLIEGDVDAHNNAQTAKTACVRLKAVDGFTVLRTSGISGTLSTYKSLTVVLDRLYSGARGPVPPGRECMTLRDLEGVVSSERTLAVRDIFKVQLQHIPGIGKQVADAIARTFPTPMSLWTQAMCGADGGADAAAERLKFIPLAQGIYHRTVGGVKARKIMNFLFNVQQHQ